MIYKYNNTEQLDNKLFENPTEEYRGAPFWAWNCELNKDELLRQIKQLKKMGFGGFHMHSRAGMATEYLSDDFMNLIKMCVNKAKDENMLAYLYDEDRWPSGFGGGYVTENPENRIKVLVFSMQSCEFVSKEEGIKNGKPYLLACFDIMLYSDGTLKSAERIGVDDTARGRKWYVYATTPETGGWFNGFTYVDTLSKKAIDEFITLTHEAYKNSVGDEFGKTIPSIFTDEPQSTSKETLDFADDTKNVHMAWTTDFDKLFENEFGIDLIPHLPELVWDLPDGRPSEVRYRYHDFVCELFTRNYADNCGKWCDENGIAFTGHVLWESSLEMQTYAVGEAMRNYRSFTIPGIDLLGNQIELSTAKQAQSVCHQYGREAMMCECYGVTNWDFDFRGHKFQGDWLAALGVTLRVPHLSWVSMKGSAKRDYPATINYQSPWYMQYPYIENHFARVNTALTRGKSVVRVGVIHPIESYWLHYGPKENNASACGQLEENFKNMIEWLLFGTVDFDFISESMLPQLHGGCDGNVIAVGDMNYSAVIVAGCETLRSSTVDILSDFAKNGGRVIFVGQEPQYVDASESNKIGQLISISEHTNMSRIAVLDKLDGLRDISIKNSNATPSDNLIYQLRRDGDVMWLFIAHAKYPHFHDNIEPQETVIEIRGEFEPIVYDTLSGKTYMPEFEIKNGNTYVKYTFYANSSLLLRLGTPSVLAHTPQKEVYGKITRKAIMNAVEFTREEANVFILDIAKYSVDGGKTFSELEEILRIDSQIRKKLDYPMADGLDVQPWKIPPEKITQFPWLKFEIDSEFEVKCRLAYEEAEEVILNGVSLSIEENGYFVDRAIKTMDLPHLQKGRNELLVRVPIGKRTSIESFYLTGEFDVRVCGCQKTICHPSDKIGFGSIASQGMPFYGGNITYKTKLTLPECTAAVRINYYRGALVKVNMDGEDMGVIAFDPYTLELGNISAGEHEFEFTLFGNRANTFGALHNCGDRLKVISGYGPDMYYSEGDRFTYDYQLFDTGIMAAPVFEIRESNV